MKNGFTNIQDEDGPSTFQEHLKQLEQTE